MNDARGAVFDGFVRVSAGRLVDGRGEPVLLRGVGLGNWLLPEGYMWKFESHGPQSPREIEAFFEELVGPSRARDFWRRFRSVFIAEADIARIRAEGMNHVRLPINSRIVMDDEGNWIEDGFDIVDRLIEWCRTHRLWVVLDLHGAPGGQTGTNIDDSPRNLPELFMQPHYRELTVRLWGEIARRYRDEPVVAAYDLLNEPLPNEYQHTYAEELRELYIDLTSTIRAVDPNHAITYEGSHWATNWSIFSEVWDDNSFLQFHKYWSPPDRLTIQKFIDAGEKLQLPIYMGEGGENNLDWIQTAFQLYEDCGISWNFWPWKKIETITSPCSVNAPIGWSEIIDYAAGKGPRPDADAAWQTLSALLDAMPLAACTYRPEVVGALLRRVPIRIPAVGFTFRGAGLSFHTTDAVPLRGFRSDDQVTIRHAGGSEPDELNFSHTAGQPRTVEEELTVSLGVGDWVAYEVELTSPAKLRLAVTLKGARTSGVGNQILEVSIDDSVMEHAAYDPDEPTVRGVTGSVVSAGRHIVRIAGLALETVIGAIEITPA